MDAQEKDKKVYHFIWERPERQKTVRRLPLNRGRRHVGDYIDAWMATEEGMKAYADFCEEFKRMYPGRPIPSVSQFKEAINRTTVDVFRFAAYCVHRWTEFGIAGLFRFKTRKDRYFRYKWAKVAEFGRETVTWYFDQWKRYRAMLFKRLYSWRRKR